MKKLRITVDQHVYDVTVELLEDDGVGPTPAPVTTISAPVTPTPVAAPASTASPATSKPLTARPAPTSSAGKDVVSQVSGVVVEVSVGVGDPVSEGQPLVTIEAMKMNTYVTAPCAGRITELHVTTGKSVLTGDVLVRLV